MFIRKILTFLLILTFSKIAVAYPISDIEKQNIQNTLNLLKEKYKAAEDNYVISGTSVYFAADMLANGASNKSLEELSTILGNYSVENINQELSRKLKTSGRTLELSNSIWGNGL